MREPKHLLRDTESDTVRVRGWLGVPCQTCGKRIMRGQAMVVKYYSPIGHRRWFKEWYGHSECE